MRRGRAEGQVKRKGRTPLMTGEATIPGYEEIRDVMSHHGQKREERR